MEYGICDLSVAPIRAEPSDKSEMVSQLLFGETVTVIQREKSWVKVEAAYDHYEGWVDEKQFMPLTKEQFVQMNSKFMPVALDVVQSAVSSERHIPILIGSSLPGFDGMNFRIGKEKFVYNGQAIQPDHDRMQVDRFIEKVALRFMNAPYLWGGRSLFGIDCSGFTQVVYKLLCIPIPRDAYQQAEGGQLIDFVAQAQEGDLAFFENDEGRITHVGIVLNDGRIIHAAGRVRIDMLDHYGIYNKEKKKYTHRLKVVKRFF